MVTGQTTREGKKHDSGKPRWELYPYDVAECEVKVLTKGAEEYEDRNWELGMPWGKVFAAIMRHLWKWWMAKILGTDGVDEETGFSHLWHARCELSFLVAYELRGLTQYDDRPTKKVVGKVIYTDNSNSPVGVSRSGFPISDLPNGVCSHCGSVLQRSAGHLDK